MEPTPQEVDRYICNFFVPESKSEVYEGALASMNKAGLPSINVSASEGKTLHVLALAVGARRILEIGSLGGYSGLWLATALPADGKLVTLELEQKRAEVSRENFARAGLSGKVDLRVGPALESLEKMIEAHEPAFDITFIDANKEQYVEYLEKALLLTRKGGLILADNALSHHALDKPEESPIARFNTALSKKTGLATTVIPTLREGIDGLAVSVVRSGDL